MPQVKMKAMLPTVATMRRGRDVLCCRVSLRQTASQLLGSVYEQS